MSFSTTARGQIGNRCRLSNATRDAEGYPCPGHYTSPICAALRMLSRRQPFFQHLLDQKVDVRVLVEG